MQLQTFTMLTEFSGGTQDIPPSNFILSPLIGASYLGCLSLRIGLHLKLEGSNKFLFGDWASPLSQGLDDPHPPLSQGLDPPLQKKMKSGYYIH